MEELKEEIKRKETAIERKEKKIELKEKDIELKEKEIAEVVVCLPKGRGQVSKDDPAWQRLVSMQRGVELMKRGEVLMREELASLRQELASLREQQRSRLRAEWWSTFLLYIFYVALRAGASLLPCVGILWRHPLVPTLSGVFGVLCNGSAEAIMFYYLLARIGFHQRNQVAPRPQTGGGEVRHATLDMADSAQGQAAPAEEDG